MPSDKELQELIRLDPASKVFPGLRPTVWGMRLRMRKGIKKPRVPPSEKWSHIIRDQDGKIVGHTQDKPEPVMETDQSVDTLKLQAEALRAQFREQEAKRDGEEKVNAPRRRGKVQEDGAKAPRPRKKSAGRRSSNRKKEVRPKANGKDGGGRAETGREET